MKTTKKHFNIFKKECRKWVDKFELNNWEINFKHTLVSDGYASATMYLKDKLVKFTLNTDWANNDGIQPTNEEIRRKFDKARTIFQGVKEKNRTFTTNENKKTAKSGK